MTSAATVITVTTDPALVEQRVLAQQGLAIALASTVLQSQLYTLVELVAQGNIGGCVALPGGGGLVLLTATTVIPFQIGFYFDAACTRIYMKETVTTFTADNSLGNYHIIANALYTGPTGTALGSIAFDESANSIALSGTGNQAHRHRERSRHLHRRSSARPACGSASIAISRLWDTTSGVCQGRHRAGLCRPVGRVRDP